jgi:hypothetical protein
MGKLTPEEFNKKYLGKNLQGNELSGAMGIGSVELPSDFGKSEYDAQAQRTDITNLNDFRAENQPLAERWKNGISKALINVPIRVADGLVTTTAAVVGGLAELGDAFVPGDNVQFSKFINNPISEVFDGISKDLQESMPVYRSDEYEEAGIGKLAYGGTFWADTMTDAASFMGASMLGGMGVSKALGGLTKASLRLSKAKTALNALEETGQLASLTNKSALMKSIAASAYGGAAESGVEARGVYNTVKEKLTAEGKLSEEEIERQAGAASNISFLTNIVLTGGANFLQFGKIFSKTADDTLDLSRLVSEGGKLKVSELSKTKKAYNFLFNNFEDFVTESGQEGAQFLSQKFLENYYTGDDDSRDDFLKSMINAVSELKSSEGIESMLAGAVLGGLSTVGKKAYNKVTGDLSETKQEEKNLQDSVNDFNKSNNLENNVFSEETKVLASQFSRNLQADAAIKEANRNNDALGADLLKTTSFGDQVVSALRVGKYDDLVEQLQDIKNSDVEETNELYKSESFNKFTEEEKNLMADTALQQADKIKKYYEKNMVKYGKVLNHEDIAKASINDSLLDFAKQRSSEINEQLKPLIDIEGEIEARYKSPEEINSLKEQNDVFSKTIKSIKSDITAKGKSYVGERDVELETAINSSNNILKLIENSITDEELDGTTTTKDREGNETVKKFKVDYKSQVLKEANKRLNNLKAAAERKAGDITEWQKYDALLKDYVKIQKIKDDVIDSRNKYAVDPEGYFAKLNQNIDNIRKNKNLKKLFTTNSQAYKGADGKIDRDTQVELPIEKGLYYTRMGRSVYRKENGERVKENGKLVVTPLVQNKRKFIEVLDTFAKINSNTGQTEAFAKIKEGDTISEISISSLNGRLNKAEFINKEGVLSQDKMTEEEAFYYNYKDRIIQYQFKKSFTEPSKLIEGQLAYNYRGDLVVRYFDEKGYPKYTSPLFSQANEIKGKAFQVTANKDTGKFKLDNSQYLKIYSVEESRKIKELIALKNSKSYFENKLSKLVDSSAPINTVNISEEDASTLKSLEEETQKLQEKIQKAEQEIKELQELVKDYELKEKPVEEITPEEAPSVLINNGLTVTTEEANNATVETVEAVIENNNEVVIDSVIADNLTPEEISVVQEETGLSKSEAVELVKSEVKKSVKNNGNVSNYLSDKVKAIIKKIVKYLLGGGLALTVYFNTGETRNAVSHKVNDFFISNTIPSDTTVSFKTSNFAVTSFDGCNAFVSNQIKHTIGKTNFENLGYYGDAWTSTGNMVRAQKGTFVYNVFKGDKPALKGLNEQANKVQIENYIKSKIKESGRLTIGNFQEGDIVNLFYEGSNYTVEAFEKGKDVYTSHVGIIKKDLKGNLVLEHNIHGIIKHDSLSDLVQGKLKSVNGSMLVSAIARPDFNKLNINIGETENIAETNKNTEKNKEPQKNNEAGSPFLLAALLLKLKKKKKETNILDDTDFSDVNKRIDFLSKSIVQLKSNLEEVKKDKEEFKNNLNLKYPSGNLVESQKNLIKKKNEEITNLRIKEKSEKDSLNPNDKEVLNEIDKRYNLLITPLLEDIKKAEALIGITSTKTTTLPHEDIMMQESAEIKKKLISLQEEYSKAEDKRKSAAKQLKKQIDFFNKKLVSIDEYSKTIEKEREKYEKYITNLTNLIEKTEKGEAIEFDELKKEYLNQIQQERGKYTNIVAELTATDEAFKQNKVLYYEVLKELREQFEDIINPDLLYSSEYFADVVNAMPDYGIDVRFKNRELTKQDFHEIVSFVIEGNGETVPTYNENTEEAYNIKLDIKELDNVGNEEYAKKIDKLDTIISAINTEAVKALAKIRSTNRKEFSEEDTINSYDFYNNIVNSIKKVEREITKDDSVFIPKKNLKIAGYNDVFIGADGDSVVISPKKTVMQGLTTTSPNVKDNFAGFPINSLNENDKHQWVFQKWLNDNDATDYYIEYKIDDKVETYTRDKSSDKDPTQKAILVQIVKKDGTPLKLDSNGKENENGIYLPISVLEAGTGNYRPVDKNGVKPAKYRETEEADLLKEELKTIVVPEEREKIQAKIEELENIVKENLANIQKQRESILQVLEKNERYVTPIVEQSLGIKMPSQDNKLSDVLGTNYKEKIRDGKLKVVIVKDTNTVIGDKTIQAAIGSVIIHEVKDKNPRIYFLKGKKINDYGFNDLVEKIQSFSANEITGTFTKDFKEFYNKIRAYVYWGSNYDINKEYNGKIIDETEGESEDKLKEKLYHLKFKYDTNSQVVEYGNYLYKDDKGKPVYDIKTVNVEDLQNDEQFREFITSKYNHFSSSLLSDYMVERITDVKNNKSASILADKLDNNFTINLQKELNVQFQSQYLTPSGERITKFEKIEQKEIKQTPTQTSTQTSTTADYSDVKFVEESLRLSDSLSYDEAIKQLEIWTEEGYLNKIDGFSLDIIYEDMVSSELETQKQGESLASSPFAKNILGIENVTTGENGITDFTIKREFRSVSALNKFLQIYIAKNPDVVGKPLPTNLQAVESTNIFGTEAGLPSTTETVVETKKSNSNENSIDNILGDPEEESANKPTNSPSEGGFFLRKSQVLEAQPKIRLQDIGIKDFVNFFGVKFEVVKALTQSVGYGVMRETANDLNSVAYAIEVEENAPLGTEYHEKFHLFERAMFSPSQRKRIYSLYRQITETTVSDAEASELLAEEFRYYSIERVAKDNRLNGTALEKVLQFIKDFISGISQLFSYNKSDKMNKLFDLMYTNTLTDSAGRTIEQAIASSTTKTKLTSEEIRATQKSALLQYYKAFENTVPNFNHIDFLIDKEYNKKAKEIYARINIIDVEDSTDAESLIINHIITNMRIENPLLFSKFKDVNNRIQFIEEFKTYFEIINKSPIDVEDLLNEELNKEDNTGGKGELFEIDATSTNYIQGLPVFVKQLLSTISGDKNYLGLTEHVDISKLEIELVNLFEKATSSVEMLKLLKESGRPEFLALASRLMTVSDKALTNKLYREARISKLNSFYTNLKKQIVSFSQVNVESEDVVTIIDKNRNTLLEKVLYDFRNNFKAKYSSTNVVELAKELQAIETSTDTDYEFITALGFTVDKNFITHLSDNGLLDTFKQNVSRIKQRDFKDKKSIEKFIKNPSEVSNVKNIADLISNYKTDSIPVQILVDNKPMYAIINRNYLFKKFNEVKNKFKDSAKGTYENQIARAKIIYNVAISTEEEIQKSSKMTEKPSFIFHIANAINKGISPYINTGDKSSYFGFQNLASLVPGEVVITEDDYVKVFKEMFKLEFETFTKFKSADEGTVMPNMKKFFSVSDDIIPAHTLEAKVFSNNELVYTDFESLYREVEKDFITNVKKEADTANKNLLQALKDNNIVENDNKTFNFINKDSLNEKGITNAEQLVERLNLFFWESNMLQSKFLFGDLGVFGLDLAKRVPAGMATKIDGNYSPVIANLLDTELNYSNTNLKFNKVDDKGELVYDVLVMDDLMHEDKVLGELFDKYTKTTLSDGMGFEHIDSIRFREISEGTWGDEDIKIYQADLKGEANLEDLHKWTMKKTQYFGEQQVKFSENSDDTMGITTFNKMAVFPISRTIIKQSASTTLAGIKKIMEDSNVPVIVFDSANKIARKSGFKLFDENGKVNTSKEIVNPYKQTQYWKYYNTQQETHKKPKSEQTLGTQFSKVIFANLLEGEGNLTIVNKTIESVTVKAIDVINKIHEFTNERVDITKKLLLERLGVSKEKGGYKVASKERLLKEIKANLNQKDVSSVLKKEVEELLLNGRGLDITVGSGSFEAVLTALVDKMIIQPKKFGSPMAQAANIGFTQIDGVYQEDKKAEFNKNQIIKLDKENSNLEPLKFYQKGDDYMEVYLPNYFKTIVDLNTIDKRLLDLIGFRIPTQGPNSIEKIRVKGFLPESYGNMIIVPAQITTKSGSDFDIDKINLYFPNFTIDTNGQPKYVESFVNDIQFKEYVAGNKINTFNKTKNDIKGILTQTKYKEVLGDMTEEDIDNMSNKKIGELLKKLCSL